MNKLDKPKIASITEILGFIITILSPLFGIKTFKLKDYLIIYSIIIVAIFIYIFIKYLYSVLKFYKKYEKQFDEFSLVESNRNALNKQFKEKQNEVAKLKNIIEQYDYVVDRMHSTVQQGACSISSEEQQYLINLYGILCKDREYINNIKGGK